MYLALTDDLETLEQASKEQFNKFKESQSDQDNAIYYQINLAISEGDKMRSALELIVNNQC